MYSLCNRFSIFLEYNRNFKTRKKMVEKERYTKNKRINTISFKPKNTNTIANITSAELNRTYFLENGYLNDTCLRFKGDILRTHLIA
jgi:hypothetical protein